MNLGISGQILFKLVMCQTLQSMLPEKLNLTWDSKQSPLRACLQFFVYCFVSKVSEFISGFM